MKYFIYCTIGLFLAPFLIIGAWWVAKIIWCGVKIWELAIHIILCNFGFHEWGTIKCIWCLRYTPEVLNEMRRH